jgi:hypothetical protein
VGGVMVVVLVVAVVVVVVRMVVVVVVRAVVPAVFSRRRAITFRAGFFVSSDFIRCRRTSGLVLRGVRARLMKYAYIQRQAQRRWRRNNSALSAVYICTICTWFWVKFFVQFTPFTLKLIISFIVEQRICFKVA